MRLVAAVSCTRGKQLYGGAPFAQGSSEEQGPEEVGT